MSYSTWKQRDFRRKCARLFRLLRPAFVMARSCPAISFTVIADMAKTSPPLSKITRASRIGIVRNAPRPIEVLEQFSKFVGDSVIMAHNGHRFDIKFLEATCVRHRVKTRPVESIDTITISKQLFGTVRGTRHGWDGVMQRLGLNASKYQRHDARGDIQALADAVKIMWSRLKLDPHCTGIVRRATLLPHV